MIYPIAEMMERFFASLVNEETGEVTMSEEEMQTALDALQMEFDDKIVELRNEVINLTAEAEALKAEKAKLDARKKVAENGAERAKRFLAYLLKGEKFEKGVCKISYRKSEEVVYDDDFIEWAYENNPGLLKIVPEVRKQDVKNALKSGQAIEHCYIKQNSNIQVK